ncbi:hypothetical protein FQZ97_810420 [compost metagenome]
MPVKACASVLPRASMRSMPLSESASAAFTPASVSFSICCSSSGRTMGCWASPSFCAAASRWAGSSLASNTAACASSRLWRACASSSPASALSINASWLMSGSSNALRCRVRAASRWRSGPAPTSSMPARALSMALRRRLLIITSPASSGRGSFSPVTASTAASSTTMNTRSPCTRTASAAMALMRADAFSSGSAASLFRVSMRTSVSPSTRARASADVRAWAALAHAKATTSKQRRARRRPIKTLSIFSNQPQQPGHCAGSQLP